MKLRSADRVTIIGAGLTGSLMAIYLLRAGWSVTVYEKRGDPRAADAYSGRSINLALATRGLHALAELGLAEKVAPHLTPMRGRMIHPSEGPRELQPYGQTEREVIYSIHRQTLNRLLVEAAAGHSRFQLRCREKLVDLDLEAGAIVTEDTVSDQRRSAALAGPVLGADGAGSKTRRILAERLGFAVDVDFLDHGYKELGVPAAADGGHAFDPGALHIWPRGGFMQIALPNTDGSFTNTLFLEKARLEALSTARAARAFLSKTFPDLQPWLERQSRELVENPIGLLGTVRCPQWHAGGTVCLIGDAAHAIVPFHGQGMNCCFEDCAVLARLLHDGRRTWRSAFEQFQRARRENTDAIATMALENYEQMRSHVMDPGYLLRRRVAFALERRHPERFIPRYSLVMFHRVPYAEALARGRTQTEILERLTTDVRSVDQVDWSQADRLIDARLPPLSEPA